MEGGATALSEALAAASEAPLVEPAKVGAQHGRLHLAPLDASPTDARLHLFLGQVRLRLAQLSHLMLHLGHQALRSHSSIAPPMMTSASFAAEPSATACPLVLSAAAMKKSVANLYVPRAGWQPTA